MSSKHDRADARRFVRNGRKRLGVLTAVAVVLLVVYAALPQQLDGISVHVIIGFCVGLVIFTTVLGYLVISGNRREYKEDRWLRLTSTLIALVAAIFFFALTYLQVARSMPGEFTGLTTFVDAIYFTIATTLTVGFGDVYASGQWARIMVIFQMLFTVVVLAAAGRSIAGVFQTKRRDKVIHKLKKELVQALAENDETARSAERAADQSD